MTFHDPRLDAVRSDLRDRGYRFPNPTTDGSAGPIVAAGGDPPVDGPDDPLSIVRPRDATPLSIVSSLAEAAHAGRVPVLVVDERDREGVRDVLGEPFLLRGRADGRRQFYAIPDRIALSDGRYACVRADEEPRWREETPTEAIENDGDRSGTDEPRLLLEADGSVQAVLRSVDELTCPGPDPEAFPYRYARGADKRMHVFDREREVGRYAGVAAMKANAYRPVPLPLVPEHHVRTGGRLARNAILATATNDGVTYDRP